uniref:Uncharacterized protein n=1 Tax=Knipowitschia caucasica TaxID=637954 RepID=A0AAV2LLG9_KNICA
MPDLSITSHDKRTGNTKATLDTNARTPASGLPLIGGDLLQAGGGGHSLTARSCFSLSAQSLRSSAFTHHAHLDYYTLLTSFASAVTCDTDERDLVLSLLLCFDPPRCDLTAASVTRSVRKSGGS